MLKMLLLYIKTFISHIKKLGRNLVKMLKLENCPVSLCMLHLNILYPEAEVGGLDIYTRVEPKNIKVFEGFIIVTLEILYNKN